MKLFIAIFFIIIMVGLSSAGQCLGCPTRHDAIYDPLVVFHKFKAYAEDAQPIIRAVIKDIPSTDGYRKYKQKLENYLKKANEKTGEMCFEFVLKNCGLFVEIMELYQKAEAPAEAKKVVKLFVKHGYMEFSEKQGSVFKNVDIDKFVQNVSRLDKTNEDKYKEFTELC